jgi:hypothetical protein
MNPDADRRSTSPLAQRVGDDADAAQVAAAIVAIWNDVDDVLTPIVGPLGVVALYKRSLHLTSAAFPWLAEPRDGERQTIEPSALTSLLAQRGSADAAAAGSAFLQTFHELLASLVGPALTERLLRDAWANTSSGLPARDTFT